MYGIRGVAKQRLKLMFTHGPDVYELDRCLRESKKKLIVAGAKADNLPSKPEQVVDFVTSLRPRAMDIVRDWFRKNATANDGPKLAIALEKVKSNTFEAGDNGLHQEFWRTVLLEFVQRECVEWVADFINVKHEEVNTSTEPTPAPPDASPSCVTEADADACLAIASGVQASYAGRFLPTLISGIMSALSGNQAEASTVAAILEGDPNPVFQKFANVVSSLGAKNGRMENAGFLVRSRREYKELQLDDPQEYPVYGQVKSVLHTGQIFVKVTGLVVHGDLVSLSSDEARELFPHQGDVTAFLSVVGGGWKPGMEGVWRVEHRSSDKSAQYVIVEQLARSYEVVQIPIKSDDPDAIRSWLTTSYKAREELLPAFQTVDRLILKLPGEAHDPAKFNFDTPLDSYTSHKAVKVTTTRIVSFEPFPTKSQRYDCAPATTWIKRLLREGATVESFPVFTRAQLGVLVDYVSSSVDPSVRRSYRRAQTKLEESLDTREEMRGAIELVLEIPRVKAAIEHEKHRVVDALRGEKAGLASEIEELRAKKRDLLCDIEKQRKSQQADLERLRKASHQQEGDLDRRIKAVFDRASKEGLETLAQTSLMRALVPSGTLGTPQIAPQEASTAPGAASNPLSDVVLETNTIVLATASELIRAINRAACTARLGDLLLSSVVAACIATSVVGLIGGKRKRVASALADTLAGGVSCEVSVTGDMFGIGDLMKAPALVRAGGKTRAVALGDFLDYQHARGCSSVIELVGANRAPPEILLPELMLLGQSQEPGLGWVDSRGAMRCTQFAGPAIFLLSFVGGKSVFPIPATLARSIPLIQVDHGWAEDEIPPAAAQVRASIVSAAVWRIICNTNETPAQIVERSGRQTDEEARLAVAAACLGIEQRDAVALGFLAFRLGREDRSTLEPQLPAGSTLFREYIQAFDSAKFTTLANHLFESEIAA